MVAATASLPKGRQDERLSRFSGSPGCKNLEQGATAVFTIIQKNFLSGEACKMKLAPDEEIATPHGRITEIRWRLDFDDQSDPVIKHGTAKVIRLNDGDVAFENEPPIIRYGYVTIDPGGRVDIVGDLTLWSSEELPEQLRGVTTPGHHYT
jgi:hypothetical protein